MKLIPPLLASALVVVLTTCAAAAEHTLFIGTFTDTTSRGMYSLRFDDATGALTTPTVAMEMKSPSFLVLSSDHHFLYAVGEDDSTANAFSIGRDGALTRLSARSAGNGTGPTHLALDEKHHLLLTANYEGGSVSVFPVQPDGGLGERNGFVQHTGSSADPERQKSPHAHGIVFSPDNAVAFVADLGLDQVLAYDLHESDKPITPHDPAVTPIVPAGSGPRHLAFSPDHRHVYVSNEMGNSVSVFRYLSGGKLSPVQHVSTLPADFHGHSGAAEIAVHPNGRFVYVSNRGYDSIAVFARDLDSGALSLVDIAPCGGKAPRHFTLSADGNWLLVANQNSDALAVFHLDSKTGRLSGTDAQAKIPHPTCILFAD